MTKRDSLETKLFLLGLGSRRECRNLIRNGLVRLDDELWEEPLAPIPVAAKKLEVNGEPISLQTRVYTILHKPAGYECSHQADRYPTVYDLLPPRWNRMGVQSAGRLDVDTSGLLILSNDGNFVHHLESPRHELGKTYEILPEAQLDKGQFNSLRAGVNLRGEKGLFQPVCLEALPDGWLRMEIREGKYHQVKRMLAAVRGRVKELRRVAIGSLILTPEWKSGVWRELTTKDFAALHWTPNDEELRD
ncbi:MAG TPA: pseudouridine synthase [Fibrobacteraceae bacterium]|nr:pseudouridine synthase [Fibrobacteraceae bacterium]